MIQQLEDIKQKMNTSTILVAVSKKKSAEEIRMVYDEGICDFGENRSDELAKKAVLLEELEKLRWHFIGHLQTNKVKSVVSHVWLIHSLDRIDLAKALQKEAVRQNKKVAVLVQVNLSLEETKGGFYLHEVLPFLSTIERYPNLMVQGIMCMAPNVQDQARIAEVFQQAKTLFQVISTELNHKQVVMKHLSMGMSNDYQIALHHGSTMIRIGTALFDGVGK